MMKTTRREVLGYGVAALATSLIPTTGVGNVGSDPHPHPHVPSYSPSHMIVGTGIEHAFLQSESSKYAQMVQCWIVVDHGNPVGAQELEQIAGFTEHVPIFVHKQNPVRELTFGDVQGILLGTIENWSDVGGSSLPIRICANGYRLRWKRAFGRIVTQLNFDGAEDAAIRIMDVLDHETPSMPGGDAINLVWGSGYREVAHAVNAYPGSLAVGLRPAFAHGLVPIRVDGWDVGSDEYPIQAPSFISFRHDIPKALSAAESMIDRLLQMYQKDEAVLNELWG